MPADTSSSKSGSRTPGKTGGAKTPSKLGGHTRPASQQVKPDGVAEYAEKLAASKAESEFSMMNVLGHVATVHGVPERLMCRHWTIWLRQTLQPQSNRADVCTEVLQ